MYLSDNWKPAAQLREMFVNSRHDQMDDSRSIGVGSILHSCSLRAVRTWSPRATPWTMPGPPNGGHARLHFIHLTTERERTKPLAYVRDPMLTTAYAGQLVVHLLQQLLGSSIVDHHGSSTCTSLLAAIYLQYVTLRSECSTHGKGAYWNYSICLE